MIKVSAVITTFNSEKTIKKCFQILAWADESLSLDSFRADQPKPLVNEFQDTFVDKVQFKQINFQGYAKQKQTVIDMASHDWVLLLDDDECLTPKAIKKIKSWQLSEPKAVAFAMPRIEWVFWSWAHPWVKRNEFVRLFNKQSAKMSQDLVHESIQVNGKKKRLYAPFKHYGEKTIQIKLDKINKYSALAAQQKYDKGVRCSVFRLFFYPPIYFIRQYLIKRQIFNGIAGVINASLNSYYAYMKYAKLYELQKNKD